jgi:hypothetical protein
MVGCKWRSQIELAALAKRLNDAADVGNVNEIREGHLSPKRWRYGRKETR